MLKTQSLVIAGTLIGSSFAQASHEKYINVNELSKNGLDFERVETEFKIQAGIQIGVQDQVKVSFDDEGKNIQIETLDHYGVVMPILATAGPLNKEWP